MDPRVAWHSVDSSKVVNWKLTVPKSQIIRRWFGPDPSCCIYIQNLALKKGLMTWNVL